MTQTAVALALLAAVTAVAFWMRVGADAIVKRDGDRLLDGSGTLERPTDGDTGDGAAVAQLRRVGRIPALLLYAVLVGLVVAPLSSRLFAQGLLQASLAGVLLALWTWPTMIVGMQWNSLLDLLTHRLASTRSCLDGSVEARSTWRRRIVLLVLSPLAAGAFLALIKVGQTRGTGWLVAALVPAVVASVIAALVFFHGLFGSTFPDRFSTRPRATAPMPEPK